MKKLLWLLFFLALNAKAEISSHCTQSESIQFNANVLKTTKDGNLPTGKVVSICANAKKEPFDNLVYRFGKIGKVELEYTAPKDGVFHYSSAPIDPHSFSMFLDFSRGKTKYEISVCNGSSCELNPVLLLVYNGSKVISEIKLDADVTKFFDDLDIDKTPISPTIKVDSIIKF